MRLILYFTFFILILNCNSNIPDGSSLEKFVDNFAVKHRLAHTKAQMNRMLA